MVKQESGRKLPPFWEKHEGTGLYINKVANCKTSTEPTGLKGGKSYYTLRGNYYTDNVSISLGNIWAVFIKI